MRLYTGAPKDREGAERKGVARVARVAKVANVIFHHQSPPSQVDVMVKTVCEAPPRRVFADQFAR